MCQRGEPGGGLPHPGARAVGPAPRIRFPEPGYPEYPKRDSPEADPRIGDARDAVVVHRDQVVRAEPDACDPGNIADDAHQQPRHEQVQGVGRGEVLDEVGADEPAQSSWPLFPWSPRALGGGARRRIRSGDGGDGAGLQQPERAAGDRPLDVHRGSVMGLDVASEPRDPEYVAVCETECPTFLARDGGGRDTTVRFKVDAGDLVAGAAPGDLSLTDGKRVRGDRSRDDALAKSPRGIDHDLVAPAGHRVRGECDPRAVGGHHRLHNDGQPHHVMGEATLGAVGDGPVRPQRRPAAPDRRQYVRIPCYAEEGLLLARERRLGQVLGGGGGPHRDRPLPQVLQGS